MSGQGYGLPEQLQRCLGCFHVPHAAYKCDRLDRWDDRCACWLNYEPRKGPGSADARELARAVPRKCPYCEHNALTHKTDGCWHRGSDNRLDCECTLSRAAVRRTERREISEAGNGA